MKEITHPISKPPASFESETHIFGDRQFVITGDQKRVLCERCPDNLTRILILRAFNDNPCLGLAESKAIVESWNF